MTTLGYTVSDALAMTRRNLIRYVRIPTLLVFSTIQPVMFVLLFAYVFGGAIKGLPAGVKYIDFLMSGIFVQTVVFGSTQTGVGLAEDLSKGMIDRFRSLPMARSAVLAGRTLGLAVHDVESAQTAGFVWVFPLTFASSVFVPLRGMPAWLQAFARANPITNAAQALRALTLGGATTRPVLYASAWIVAVLAVFMPLATPKYRKLV